MITTAQADQRTVKYRHLIDAIIDRRRSGPEKGGARASSLRKPRERAALVWCCLGVLWSAAHITGAQPIDHMSAADTGNNRTPAALGDAAAQFWMAQAQAEVGADLSLTMTVSDRSPVIGMQVTFQVIVANAGPGPTQRIVVRDRWPGGYTYVSHQATRGTYAPSTGQWNGFGLGATGSATLTIVATVNPSGNRTNVAEIVDSTSPDPDSTPGNGNRAEDDYAQAPTRPRAANVIVVMLDDLDVRSLADLLHAGFMPNLQSAFIERGIEFSQSFVSTPSCAPSRATFLTGQYAHNTGIVNNALPFAGQGLAWAIANFDDSVTLATRLQGLGYTTAHVGKYINGYGSNPALAPLAPAFDPRYVPPGWSHWRALVDFTTYCVYNYSINADGVVTQYMRPPGQPQDSATYQTNVLADLAESFVLDHRDDAAPFYLEVMPLAAHAETCSDAYDGPVPYNDDFKGRIRPAPEDATAAVPAFVPSAGYDEDLADKPIWLSGLPALTPEDYTNLSEQYEGRLRAVLSTDRLIGRVVAALGTHIEDTVLIFTADNGWLYGEHRRTAKYYAYEEAARVPLYVVMPDSQAPSARANVVLNNDLAPTILALASPGYADVQFDGRSLVPILRESVPPGWTDRVQFLIEFGRTNPSPTDNLYPTYSALRRQNTPYIETYGGLYNYPPHPVIGLELYDLSSDPNQMNSLLHYPENPRDAVLAPWLDLLVTCAGPSCQQYEDAQGP